MKKRKVVKSDRINTILNTALMIILVLVIINLFIIQARIKKVKEAQEIIKEKQRPAILEVKKIVLSDCSDCYDIDLALEDLKKQNVNITSEITLQREDSSELIDMYNIENLPALIISGEVNKSEQLNKFLSANGNVIDNNTAVYKNIKPPYYNIIENKVVGRVSIIHLIDSSCTKCISLLSLTSSLTQAGAFVFNEKIIEFNSTQGKELINLSQVKKIPAVLISDEIDYYPELKKQLEEADTTSKNNYYAVHALAPPYIDLQENKIVGLVDVVFITDSSCKECYDVNINKQVLRRFGVTINTESTYDINSTEGKELISKYGIEKVPVLITSPDTSAYELFTEAWASVGTVEDDGWYIMKEPDILGTYKDLTTNQVIEGKNG